MALVLAWPGALVIGLTLGLMGSGGSILTVPVLIYLLGQEEKLAIAGSLAIVGMISLAASIPYIRDRLVDWRSVFMFGIPGMIGTYFGAWSSAWVDGSVQLMVFAGVMLGASWMMLRRQPLQAASDTPRSPLKITGDGLAVGALTGFVGVGGGFLVVPALVLLGGLSMHRAIATSLVIIAAKSAAGFYKYLDVLDAQNLQLDWGLIGLVSAVGILGSLLGNQWACNLSQERLKRGFGYFLILMGVFIAVSTLPQLM